MQKGVLNLDFQSCFQVWFVRLTCPFMTPMKACSFFFLTSSDVNLIKEKDFYVMQMYVCNRKYSSTVEIKSQKSSFI